MNPILRRLYVMRTVILFAGILSSLSIAQTVGDLTQSARAVEAASQHGPVGLLSLAVVVLAAWTWWKDFKLTKVREKELRVQFQLTELLRGHVGAMQALAHAIEESPCLWAAEGSRRRHDTPNPVRDIMDKLPMTPPSDETPV